MGCASVFYFLSRRSRCGPHFFLPADAEVTFMPHRLSSRLPITKPARALKVPLKPPQRSPSYTRAHRNSSSPSATRRGLTAAAQIPPHGRWAGPRRGRRGPAPARGPGRVSGWRGASGPSREEDQGTRKGEARGAHLGAQVSPAREVAPRLAALCLARASRPAPRA